MTPSSRPSHPAVAHDESLWYTGQPAYELVRSNWASHAISETPSNIFLPVQSQNHEDLGAGKLLVASRALADPNFAETVVLLVRCDAEGVVGLILNRRTNIPLSRVLEQFESAKDRSARLISVVPSKLQRCLRCSGRRPSSTGWSRF